MRGLANRLAGSRILWTGCKWKGVRVLKHDIGETSGKKGVFLADNRGDAESFALGTGTIYGFREIQLRSKHIVHSLPCGTFRIDADIPVSEAEIVIEL